MMTLHRIMVAEDQVPPHVTIDRDKLVQTLIARLAAHQKTASEMDYGRIEEICYLIRGVMFDVWPGES